MKKYYLFIVLLGYSVSNAQIVNIPDANFKAELISRGFDTNSDGEIQNSEAAAVTFFATSNSLINDVSGIEAFINLEELGFQQMPLTSLNLTNLTQLTTLRCTDLAITSLDVSNLTNLNYLDCGGCTLLSTLDVTPLINLTYLRTTFCPISTLNLTNLVDLTYLDCAASNLSTLNVDLLTNLTHLAFDNNPISTINLSNNSDLDYLTFSNCNLANVNLNPLANLKTLDCSNNPLSSLNLSTLVNLEKLYISNLPLISFDLSALTNLQWLVCLNNNTVSLDLSAQNNLNFLEYGGPNFTTCNLSNLNNLLYLNIVNSDQTSLNLSNLTSLIELTVIDTNVSSIDISNSPDLWRLRLEGNLNLTYLNMKNGNINYNTFIDNSPNLTYICCDESIISWINSIVTIIGSNNNPNVQVNSYCSFSPSGVYNTITGTVTFDINNNGCDATDYNPANFKMQLFDGTDTGASFTNNSGDYLFYTQAGNFDVSPQLQNPYFNVTPATTQLTFPTVDGSNQILDVCITPNGIHNDVEIAILPITPPRPGFDVDYLLSYTNKGNQVLSGSVNYTFDDAVLDFISATPTITSQSVNNLTWTYTNLSPFESRSINITLNLNGPTETPPVNINDDLTCSATINPISGDETPDDNTFELEEIVIGAYDPNDKTCLEGDTITPLQVGDYLHYLIRFQNSGTAPAVNVVVKDMIDTTKFDIASLQLISASHQHITRITNNKVEFIFENIQLPAEQDDEPGSHGFVAFKIKTKSNLVLGNSVSNTASIYFDYNFPIITNTTSTTVSNLGVTEFENMSVAMTPNPVKNILNITAIDVISSVLIYDVQGRLIAKQVNNSNATSIDMSQQNSGIYFVKVQTENGVKVEKIIKN